MDDLRALLDQIEQHPGTKAHRNWQALRTVHSVLLGNQAELSRFITAVEANEDGAGLIMMSNVGSPEPRQNLFVELVRLLHNYLAAVVTLIDHTRNLMHDYGGSDFEREYLSRLEAIKANGISALMSKLRVYLLHYRIPPVGGEVKFEAGQSELAITLFLDRNKALDWADWPVGAREYLSAQAEHIPLAALIREYEILIEDLYRWLYEQFTRLHGEDITAVNALISQTPRYKRPDGTPGNPEQ